MAEIIRDTLLSTHTKLAKDPLIARSDFDDRVDIIPVSDPNATSFAQRMSGSKLRSTSAQAPQLYDLRKLHRAFLTTTGVEDVDSILPDPTEIPAYDPISENARLMSGAKGSRYMSTKTMTATSRRICP